MFIFLDNFILRPFWFVEPSLLDGGSYTFAKEEANVDEENNEELPDWNDCKFKWDFDSSHANLFDVDKLSSSEFMSNCRIVIVVDQEIEHEVQADS